MKVIKDVTEVFDNGTSLPLYSPQRLSAPNPQAWRRQAMRELRARYRVATRWTYRGRIYEDRNCPTPLPDMSGLVYATKSWKKWIVLDPEGHRRLEIRVPRISDHSMPEDGHLGIPEPVHGGPYNVMYGDGSDGHRDDCRFFFDMHAGVLLRVELGAKVL